jgi:hypothetical protein
MTLSGWALVLLAAASGQVVDPAGKPIEGAEACTGAKETLACVKTDAHGFYRIEKPASPKVFIRASGFVPSQAESAEQVAPIKLARAATLTVKAVDSVTGQSVPAGRVILTYTSGQGIGTSAPFNKNGVRFTTIVPGEVLARTESDGYDPGGPEAIHLEGGDVKTLTIGMKRRAPIVLH